MKPSSIAGPLLLLLSAAPLFARSVFVPLPRNPNPGALEYKVKVLATNQGLQTRRFQVFRIIPQPFGPPSQEKLADRGVLARAVGIFEMSSMEELSGLLRVTGAPQMVVGALLEVRENGKLLDTVSLPVVSAAEKEDHERGGAKHDDDFDHSAHLQGLAASSDGSVTTDLTLVNLSEDVPVECAVEFFHPSGLSLQRFPSVRSPIGAAAVLDDVFDQEVATNVENVRTRIDCVQETFSAWAAVYRDGGRDVVYLTPSASTK